MAATHHSTTHSILCNSYSMGSIYIMRTVHTNAKSYAILPVGKSREGYNACYGRIRTTYSRGCCTHSQDKRGKCQDKTQKWRDQGLQAWSWLKKSLENQARRVKALYRRARVSTKLKAAFSRRPLKNLVASILLSTGYQSLDSRLDSRYLFVNYTWVACPKAIVQYRGNRQYGWQVR